MRFTIYAVVFFIPLLCFSQTRQDTAQLIRSAVKFGTVVLATIS